MTPVSTCLLFMTPGRSKGTRQEDAFTLLESLLERCDAVRGPGNTLGQRRNSREMEPQGGKSVILMDTFMAWESSVAVILSRRPADTSQTIHVRALLSRSEQQMHLSSHCSRPDLSDWWAGPRWRGALVRPHQSHLCSDRSMN